MHRHKSNILLSLKFIVNIDLNKKVVFFLRCEFNV
jgi:hypothetical protein